MNATKTTTADIALIALGKTYGRFGYSEARFTHRDIVSILEDETMLVEGEYGDDTTLAAEKVREFLWSAYTGGTVSAAATCDLFHALGRQDELGWVSGEAAFPQPYGEAQYGRFISQLDEAEIETIKAYTA